MREVRILKSIPKSSIERVPSSSVTGTPPTSVPVTRPLTENDSGFASPNNLVNRAFTSCTNWVSRDAPLISRPRFTPNVFPNQVSVYSGVDVTCTFCKPGAARDAARSNIGTCASAIALAAVSGAPRLDPTVTSTSFPETLRPPIC